MFISLLRFGLWALDAFISSSSIIHFTSSSRSGFGSVVSSAVVSAVLIFTAHATHWPTGTI